MDGTLIYRRKPPTYSARRFYLGAATPRLVLSYLGAATPRLVTYLGAAMTAFTLSGCGMLGIHSTPTEGELNPEHSTEVKVQTKGVAAEKVHKAASPKSTVPNPKDSIKVESAGATKPKLDSGKIEPLKAAVQAETQAEPQPAAHSLTPPTSHENAQSPMPPAKEVGIKEVQDLVVGISTRVDAIEGKITTLSDRLDSTRASIDSLQTSGLVHAASSSSAKMKHSGVTPHPADLSAATLEASLLADGGEEAGFVNDEAIHEYRRGLILLRAKNYPETVLNFSAFVEKYPDHPLAGSAQFYVGESYLKQKEYKLALQEFQRVLTTYHRSPQITQTLMEMALAEDELKQKDNAAHHRQLLSSLFPHSPAASGLIVMNSGTSAVSPSPVTGAKPQSQSQPQSMAPSTSDQNAPQSAPLDPMPGSPTGEPAPSSDVERGPSGKLDELPSGTPPTAPIAPLTPTSTEALPPVRMEMHSATEGLDPTPTGVSIPRKITTP